MSTNQNTKQTSDSMKIFVLIVNPVSELSGSSRSLFTLAKSLSQTPGFQVEVALGEEGWLSQALKSNGIPVHQIDHPKLSSRAGIRGQLRYLARLPRAINDFRKFCTSRRPSVVHLNTTVSPFALIGARMANTPCIVHFRERVSSHYAYQSLAWLAKLFASEVLANSRFTASELIKCGCPSKVVYNGFPDPSQNPNDRSPLTVLTVTRICPDKGTDLVLETFARVQAQIPGAKLNIVGGTVPGQEYFFDDILKRIENLSLQNNVSFAGWREDIEPYYREAKVLLQLPRMQEPFGRTLVEAALHGIPAVAWARGGMTEILEDGVTGFLIPPENIDAAAARVIELLLNKEQAIAMGITARTRSLAKFTEEASLQAMITIYTNTASHALNSGCT